MIAMGVRARTPGPGRRHANAASSLLAAGELCELAAQLAGDFVHPLLGYRRTIGLHHLEDPGSAQFPRQVRRPGHYVEVNGGEPLRLGDLCDISLLAAENLVQRLRQANLPAAE